MPKTPSTRNTLPVPYSLTPSPASQVPDTHTDRGPKRTPDTLGRQRNAQASSSLSISSNSQIWRSIESIVLSQRTAIQAQAQKLAEISSSIEKRLDRIYQSQCGNASSIKIELAELKALVGQKRDEGFRFQGMECEKMMEVGWIADRGIGIGLDRAIRSGGGAMISGGTQDQEQEGGMRFEELIDMTRFEESSRPESRNDVPHDQDQDPGDGGLGSTPLSFAPESSCNSSPENEGSEDGDVLNIDPDTLDEARLSVPPSGNAVAGSSTIRDRPRSRAGSEISLSSGIESLPETETQRSRAGSDITDILTGINTYLARPNRTRPTSISKSPTPPPPPEHRLRKRTKRPIYSSKWHPMDSTRKQLRLEDEAQKAAEMADEEERSVRGLSTAPRNYLLKSDGTTKEGGKEWWKRGENSLKGRLQETSCVVCRGRVHWTCAGFSGYDDERQESWACPDCFPLLGMDVDITFVQQDRCIRPDCILRSKRSVKKRPGDESRHVIEKIIGRRTLSRRVNGSRCYEYLTKWDTWEVFDATWQKPRSFDDGVTHLENTFLAECVKEGLNTHARVVLLKEAEEWWDENGDLMREKCEDLGIVPAEWWQSPMGKHKVLIA